MHIILFSVGILEFINLYQTERTNLQHIDARSRFVDVTFEK